MSATDAERLGLPPRIFMYHLDQVATMLSVDEKYFRRAYVYYKGRTAGPPKRDKIHATNIAPEGEEPAWRVSEKDLTRWLKFKGLRFYTRGF